MIDGKKLGAGLALVGMGFMLVGHGFMALTKGLQSDYKSKSPKHSD